MLNYQNYIDDNLQPKLQFYNCIVHPVWRKAFSFFIELFNYKIPLLCCLRNLSHH